MICRRYLPLVLMVLLLVSCGKTKIAGVMVQLSDDGQKLSSSDVVSPVGWISLEDSTDFVIGSVERIIENEREIYILETSFQNCVLVFDRDGKCMRRIGVMGAGVGEYPKALDFALDEKTGDVTILSYNSKVYKYDNNGTFLSSHEIEENVILRNIVHTTYGYVATTNHSSGADAYLIYWFDDNYNCVGRAIKTLGDQYDVPVFGYMLNVVEGIAYYNDYYAHRIYKCSQYSDYSEVISYSYPNPMPKDSYEGMTFFEDQTKYDFTNGIVNLKDKIIIKSLMSMRFDVAVVSDQGQILKQGTLLLPMQIFNGVGETLLSPVSVEEFFNFGQKYSDLLPDKEPSPDDNVLLLRWRLAE